MRGRAPVAMNGAATSSDASKVSAIDRPRSSASLARAYSWSAQSGLSRRRAMRHDVSVQVFCSSARGRENTGFASHQNSTTSFAFGLPMIWLAAPSPAARSASITAPLSAARICSTAPSSSENSAFRISSLRRTSTCAGRIL